MATNLTLIQGGGQGTSVLEHPMCSQCSAQAAGSQRGAHRPLCTRCLRKACPPPAVVDVLPAQAAPVAPGGTATSEVLVDARLIGWVGDERVPGRGGRLTRRWWAAHRESGDARIRARLDGFSTRKAAVEALVALVGE